MDKRTKIYDYKQKDIVIDDDYWTEIVKSCYDRDTGELHLKLLVDSIDGIFQEEVRIALKNGYKKGLEKIDSISLPEYMPDLEQNKALDAGIDMTDDFRNGYNSCLLQCERAIWDITKGLRGKKKHGQ